MFGKSRIKYSQTLTFAILADGLITSVLVHCFSWKNLLLFFFLGCKVVHSSESYTWSRVRIKKLRNLYGLPNSSWECVWVPIQNFGLIPFDNVVFLGDMVCDCWFALLNGGHFPFALVYLLYLEVPQPEKGFFQSRNWAMGCAFFGYPFTLICRSGILCGGVCVWGCGWVGVCGCVCVFNLKQHSGNSASISTEKQHQFRP